jgi:hypothetical protein
VLIGIAALVFLLGEPHVEGRNVNATLFEIYFRDPFLAYAYLGSIPFFVGLYTAFGELGYAAEHRTFSPSAAASLRRIRVCALATIGLVALGEVFIFLSESDDRAGGVALGVLVSSASAAVAATTVVLERALRKTGDATPNA